MKFKGTKPLKNQKKNSSIKPAVKKQEVKGKFPRNSRFIPEKPFFTGLAEPLKKMSIFFVFLTLLAFIMLASVNLYKNYLKEQTIEAKRQKIVSEANIWKSFAQKYPNYKEVYFQIAVREFELGDLRSSVNYLQKALYIDPNYGEALALKKQLEGE